MTHPLGAQSGYRRVPLSAEQKARGEANFAPLVAQMLVARGRFRVSADSPDQVELFQRVARRVSDMLQRPVVSYANGREIVITFGQEAPALALRCGIVGGTRERALCGCGAEPAQLGAAFASVTCVRPAREAPVVIRDATVAADYVASWASFYQDQIPRPWPEVVQDVRQGVQAVIDQEGAFVVSGDLAAFVCR